jgi:putative membrane protein
MTDNSEEHGGMRRAVDKVQDAVGGLAGRAAAGMVSSADKFVERASIGDMYEIEAARLALRRSTSPQIHAVALQMLADHTTSKHQLGAAMEMSETREVPAPPLELDARHRTMIEHLDTAPADAFDATYIDQQVLAHEETLALLTHYRDKGDNPQLRSYAAGSAPVVERHLHHVKDLRSH